MKITEFVVICPGCRNPTKLFIIDMHSESHGTCLHCDVPIQVHFHSTKHALMRFAEVTMDERAKTLLYQYVTVQDSGKVQMWNREDVHRIAGANHFNELELESATPQAWSKAMIQCETWHDEMDCQDYQRWVMAAQMSFDVAKAVLAENL